MDEHATIFVILLLTSLAVVGAVMLLAGTLDSTVIMRCEKYGQYNFGQTRIICSVEKPGAK